MVTRRKRLTDYERAVNAFVERYNVPLDGMRATHCVWIAGWLAGWKARGRSRSMRFDRTTISASPQRSEP